MHQMEQRGVEFLAPVESCIPQPGNPALRDDPTQPVADSQKSQLPRNRQGQLAKSCFVYVAKQDTYYCPQGNAMPHAKSKRDRRGHAPVTRRIYRCSSCDGCPWAADCISATTKPGRTITRDEYEEVRERTVVRMSQVR